MDLSRLLLGGNKHRTLSSSISSLCDGSLSSKPYIPSRKSTTRTLDTASVTPSLNSKSGTNKTESKQVKKAPRVRFEIDPESDDVKATVCEYEQDLDSDELGRYYCPRWQLKLRKSVVIQKAHDFALENRDYVRTLEGLFNSPLSPSTASNKSKRLDDSFSCSGLSGIATEEDDDDDVGVLFDLHGDCYSASRGLEPFMVPILKRHKQWAIRTTIRRHRQLVQESQRQERHKQQQKKKMKKKRSSRERKSMEKTDNVDNMNVDNSVAEVLRLCCEVINASARDLALVMAEADSREAQKIYKEL
jgi:hypothetical protein